MNSQVVLLSNAIRSTFHALGEIQRFACYCGLMQSNAKH